uniref:Uncharacterized protein n=1 Tax=viral metagenome TaxID=1070528 RepID=A0A6C0JA94_9ZZZZ
MDLGYIISLLTRSLMLGSIVFYTTSTIPATAISTYHKIVISLIVVMFYSSLDYIGVAIKLFRRLMCKLLCGCSPKGNESYISNYHMPAELGTFSSQLTPEPMGDNISPDIQEEIDQAILKLKQSTESIVPQTDMINKGKTDAEIGEDIKQKAETEAQSSDAPKPNDLLKEGFALY